MIASSRPAIIGGSVVTISHTVLWLLSLSYEARLDVIVNASSCFELLFDFSFKLIFASL